MRWHFHLTSASDGAWNMALDEALMRRAARTGEAAFRIYGWSIPTLSLGRNQRARGCYDEFAARELGVQFVRRPTGGRALMHHREVTYSATMPIGDASGARDAYDFINGVLLAGLSRLGVEAERATRTESLAPGVRPCFDVPAERELVVRDRKLVGSAQWRHGGALLQHGSILIENDQPMIARILKTPGGAPPDAPPIAATLAESLGRAPSLREVADPVLDALQSATGQRITALAADAVREDEIEALRRAYSDDSWTWRR